MEESIYQDGFIANSNHQIFQDPRQKIKNIFIHIFHFLLHWDLFFFSNFHFLVGSHHPDRPLFKQKLFFSIIFSWYYFTTAFILDMSIFCQFSFFRLLFKVKHYPITKKKWNEKTIFFVFFFQKFKTYFLFWQKSKFLNLNDIMKFINRTGKPFFSFLTEKSQHVHLLY